ncbi:MAG: hypothetical protein II556_02210 [Bacteroidales bacterium]|nr:hypothetical protein [Bacteroidales bacterium]
MKIKYLIASLVLGSMLFASCSKDDGINYPNTNNKGKAKPTVGVEITDKTDVGFNIKLTPSADVQNYAYAVYTSTDGKFTNSIPDAYSIVTKSASGTYVAGSIIKGDETSKDVKINCVLQDYYQVCVAAISKDGLLGEVETTVVNIPGAHPDITFKEGYYTITPDTKADLEPYGAYDAPYVGQPFQVAIGEVEPGTFVMTGAWFGEEKAALPLRGSYDYSENTLTFDGLVYGKEASGTYFGENGTIYALVSPSSCAVLYAAPIVLKCTVKDKIATVTEISDGYMQINVHGYPEPFPYIGMLGYFEKGYKIEYTAPLQ